jgi:protein kinase C substrate 80K-H
VAEVPEAQKRRRLEEELPYDDLEDDYEGRYHDDDYLHRDDLEKEDLNAGQVQAEPDDSLSGLQKELVEKVQALPFSFTRNAFVTRAKEVMAQIASVMATQPDTPEKEGEDEEETSKEQETQAEAVPTLDPVAYNMLRNSLQRKISTITKGFNWGASSFLFTSKNPDLTPDQLRQLALFTIYFGNISTLQVWQVLQGAVEELFVPPPTDVETCASPWASSCPPKTVTRNGVTIPNASLVQAAQSFCSGQTEAVMASCGANAVDANGIPTTIPEGYYGYSTPVPRDQEDPIAILFAPLTALPVDKEGLENHQKEQDRVEKEKKNVEKKISDLWNEIGGKNGDGMGPNGELYSLANKCFEVEAGKYTYEVCVFGQAKQKEETGGGTGLGTFTKMDRDAETGQRILLWENGQKCWNGPHRSATVYLTCGPDNKVLSADEPDTCRYVLQMESYIACDDEYKQRVGL